MALEERFQIEMYFSNKVNSTLTGLCVSETSKSVASLNLYASQPLQSNVYKV